MLNKKNILNTLIITALIAFFSLFFNFYIDSLINRKVVEKELIINKKEINIIKRNYKIESIKMDSIKQFNDRDHKKLSDKIDHINDVLNKNMGVLNKNINILTYLVIKNNTKIKEQLDEIKQSSENQYIYSKQNEYIKESCENKNNLIINTEI